jgi:hypothetical protein
MHLNQPGQFDPSYEWLGERCIAQGGRDLLPVQGQPKHQAALLFVEVPAIGDGQERAQSRAAQTPTVRRGEALRARQKRLGAGKTGSRGNSAVGDAAPVTKLAQRWKHFCMSVMSGNLIGLASVVRRSQVNS